MTSISAISDRAVCAQRLLAPGARMPVYLLMFVTNRCAARCEHCFYWSELNTKVKEELTVEEFEQARAEPRSDAPSYLYRRQPGTA